MMKKIFLVLTILSVSAFAQNRTQPTPYQYTRFETALSQLEGLLSSDRSAAKVVKNLVDSSEARIAAFNLQALAKIYVSVDPLFNQLRQDFKSIEDGIGKVDKWDKLNNADKKKKAADEFATVLKNGEWTVNGASPRLARIKESLKKYSWPSRAEDRSFILTQLTADLDKIRTTAFNFGQLEEGNGLHEFRREVRWFTIKARVLNGLLQFRRGTSCPVDELKPILNSPAASGKYATLPPNPSETNSCAITQCLFVDMSQMVEQMGAIKDEVEQKIGNTDSDQTPVDLKLRAESLYDAFKRRDTLSRLATDLKACNR